MSSIPKASQQPLIGFVFGTQKAPPYLAIPSDPSHLHHRTRTRLRHRRSKRNFAFDLVRNTRKTGAVEDERREPGIYPFPESCTRARQQSQRRNVQSSSNTDSCEVEPLWAVCKQRGNSTRETIDVFRQKPKGSSSGADPKHQTGSCEAQTTGQLSEREKGREHRELSLSGESWQAWVCGAGNPALPGFEVRVSFGHRA
ncbi:hypothetical protein CI238_01808 [Colletotrichum incanum]|uniref:Uncharacterized protein n=1 Tax=Colletotrichum incanum TaxID=1573173 RepID=A0A167B3D5_COLIC|nr:hypothetical protein CI238_01808 [Colletotrichum incanum]